MDARRTRVVNRVYESACRSQFLSTSVPKGTPAVFSTGAENGLRMLVNTKLLASAAVLLIVSTLPYEASTFRFRLSVSWYLKLAIATLRSTGARRLVRW